MVSVRRAKLWSHYNMVMATLAYDDHLRRLGARPPLLAPNDDLLSLKIKAMSIRAINANEFK